MDSRIISFLLWRKSLSERENHCNLMRTSISSHFSNSTVNYTQKVEFSAHFYLKTFEELRLGFPKRPWFLKFIHMQTRGEPLKDEHFCELFDMGNFGAWKRLPCEGEKHDSTIRSILKSIASAFQNALTFQNPFRWRTVANH